MSWLEEQGGSKWLGLDHFIWTMMIENEIEYFQLVLKIELDKHKHEYSYPKIKLFIWKNKIDTHHN